MEGKPEVERFPFEQPEEAGNPVPSNNATTPPESKGAPPLLAVRDGIAVPESVEQQLRLAGLYLKAGIVPARFNTREKVVAALHFAGENFPKTRLTVLRQIAEIEGAYTMFGDLPLAKIQDHRDYAGIKEILVNKDMVEICPENKNIFDEAAAAICTVYRKINGKVESCCRFYTMKDAEAAQLLNRKSWKQNPKDMLKYRARGRAIKDFFADALNGAAIGEFDFHQTIDGDFTTISVEKTPADEINEKFGEND